MLIDFFLHLKANKLPVSTKEFLTLLEALQQHVIEHSLDDFYILARSTLVKDETHFDKFDLYLSFSFPPLPMKCWRTSIGSGNIIV